MPNSALSSIHVVGFARVLAGTYCTMLLADFSADVIRIEGLEDDETCQWGLSQLQAERVHYLSVNRNQPSITLELKNSKGQLIARRLSERADVLVENFTTAGMAKLGLDYEQAKTAIDFSAAPERYIQTIRASK